MDDVAPNPEVIAKGRRILEARAKQIDEFWAGEYDGVHGMPPEWVPEPNRARFCRIREYATRKLGYTKERLLAVVTAYPDRGGIGLYPNGQMIGAEYHDTVGYLASVLACVREGPDALAWFAGEDSASGCQVAQRAPATAGKARADQYKERDKDILATAERLRLGRQGPQAKRPRAGPRGRRRAAPGSKRQGTSTKAAGPIRKVIEKG